MHFDVDTRAGYLVALAGDDGGCLHFVSLLFCFGLPNVASAKNNRQGIILQLRKNILVFRYCKIKRGSLHLTHRN
jgi:hypothetical protein